MLNTQVMLTRSSAALQRPVRRFKRPSLVSGAVTLSSSTTTRRAADERAIVTDDTAKLAEIVMPRADVAAIGGEPQVTQHFERAQQHRQRGSAGGDPFHRLRLELGRGCLHEPPHHTLVGVGPRPSA